MGFSAGMMTGLLAANTALTQAQVHQNAISHMDSRANILESEIKSGYGDVEGKKAELEDIREQRVKAEEMQMQSLNEASGQIGTALEPEEETTGKTEKSEQGEDTKTASDKAKNKAQELAKNTPANNIAPVDYKQGIQIGKDGGTNMAISPAFLEKLADNEQLTASYQNYLTTMASIDADTQSDVLMQRTWSVDADGRITHHASAASAQDAAAYEPIRQQIEAAGSAAFGDMFAGARITVQASAPHVPEADSVGVLIRTEV